MSHNYEIKKQWITKAGYKALILYVHDSHHCGYVSVPKTHPFYEKDYNYHLSKKLWDKITSSKKKFRGSPMDLLIASYDKQEDLGPQISYTLDVHGGITFSNNMYIKECDKTDWYFGYDCGHLGDVTGFGKRLGSQFHDPNDTFKDVDYCERECESLAEQLKQYEGYNGNG